MNRRISTAVCALLWALSVVNWMVLTGGFGRVYYIYKNIGSEFAPPDGFQTFVEALLSPFWMYIVSAVPVYVLHMLHICMRNCNKKFAHILHSLLMFFNLFFIASGGISIFIATGFVFGEKTVIHFIKLDTEGMKITLGGGFVCLLFHWIGTSILPLLNLQRRQERDDYEELQESAAFR